MENAGLSVLELCSVMAVTVPLIWASLVSVGFRQFYAKHKTIETAPPYSLRMRLYGPHSVSGRFRKEVKPLPFSEIGQRFVCFPARSLVTVLSTPVFTVVRCCKF
jgi:hypothetical protein